ncbi:DUF1611 domain-containing protein [Methanopyrus sp.]
MAEESGSRLIDVRKPRKELFRVANGSARDVDATVLTTGTDCAVGKMSAAIELAERLREEGVEAAFLATGQTGIMIGLKMASWWIACPGTSWRGPLRNWSSAWPRIMRSS